MLFDNVFHWRSLSTSKVSRYFDNITFALSDWQLVRKKSISRSLHFWKHADLFSDVIWQKNEDKYVWENSHFYFNGKGEMDQKNLVPLDYGTLVSSGNWIWWLTNEDRHERKKLMLIFISCVARMSRRSRPSCTQLT